MASALLKGKCPRCRTGNMFVYPASNLKHFNKMHAACPHCDVRLQPEPGFYQGAMYVSYAFTVALMVAVGLLLYVLFDDPDDWVYITVVLVATILFVPLNYRYARIVYLYSFGGIKYDPAKSQ